MKKTKILFFSFTVIAVMFCLALTSFAAISGDYEYTVLSDNTVKITKYTGNASVVSIPSKLDGKTVSVIGEYAFNGNNFIKSLTVPGTVTELENSAIHMCEKIETITISDGKLTYIDGTDIEACYSLKTLYVPDTVESVGVLMRCTALENIVIDANNPYLVSVNGVVYSKDMKSLIKYPQGKKTNAFLVPSSVTEIRRCAFYEVAKNVNIIYIPTTVKTIDETAFAYSRSEIHYEGAATPKEWKSALSGRKVICNSSFLGVTSNLSFSCSANSITLKWNAVENAGGYRVFVKNTHTGKWDIAVRTTGKNTTTTIKNLEQGTKYTFAVRAYVNNGAIVWAPKYKSVNAVTKPGVTNKLSFGSDNTWIKLSWDKVPGATGYRVYVLNNGSWKALKTTADTIYVNHNLKAATKYTYAVRAYTKYNGAYYWADSYAKVVAATAPAVPQSITATKTSDSITLNWSKVSSASGYRVFVLNESNRWSAVKTTAGTSYTVKNLESGRNYAFAVRPYINTGSHIVWAASYVTINVKTN